MTSSSKKAYHSDSEWMSSKKGDTDQHHKTVLHSAPRKVMVSDNVLWRFVVIFSTAQIKSCSGWSTKLSMDENKPCSVVVSGKFSRYSIEIFV